MLNWAAPRPHHALAEGDNAIVSTPLSPSLWLLLVAILLQRKTAGHHPESLPSAVGRDMHHLLRPPTRCCLPVREACLPEHVSCGAAVQNAVRCRPRSVRRRPMPTRRSVCVSAVRPPPVGRHCRRSIRGLGARAGCNRRRHSHRPRGDARSGSLGWCVGNRLVSGSKSTGRMRQVLLGERVVSSAGGQVRRGATIGPGGVSDGRECSTHHYSTDPPQVGRRNLKSGPSGRHRRSASEDA
jgi:hypothetical protein